MDGEKEGMNYLKATTFKYGTRSAGVYMIGMVESKKNGRLGDAGESCVSHTNPQDSPVKIKDMSTELFMSHKRLIEEGLRKRQEHFLRMRRIVKEDIMEKRTKEELRRAEKELRRMKKREKKILKGKKTKIKVHNKVKNKIKTTFNRRFRNAYHTKLSERANRYVEDLKRRETPGERAVKEILDTLGLKYLAQKAISTRKREDGFYSNKGFYIVDFDLGNLIIEVDGSHHEHDVMQIEQDKKKDSFLRSLGKVVLRLPNWQVLSNPESVKKIILNEYWRPSSYSSMSDLYKYVIQDSLLPLGEECSDMRRPKSSGAEVTVVG